MSETEIKDRVAANFKRAYIQAISGCGRKICLNKFCNQIRKGLSANPNLTALNLLEVAKKSPDGDLEKSTDFMYCESFSPSFSASELINADPQTIFDVFSDISSLGVSFYINENITETNPNVDWVGFHEVFSKMNGLAQQGALSQNWLMEAVKKYSLTNYRKLYYPRVALMLLTAPEGLEIDNYHVLIFLNALLCSSPQLLESFSCLVDTLDSRILQIILWHLQQFVSLRILRNLRNKDLLEISWVIKVMEILYNSNEKYKRINYQEFYNEVVNKEINLKNEYKYWSKQKKHKNNPSFEKEFTFASYPWLFDSNSKSIFLQLESKEQMLREIEMGSLMYVLGLDDPYTHLEIRRDHLIEDALTRLSSGELNIKKPLKVHFVGEDGVDEGGVRKEFFQLIIKELFGPGFAMFNYYENQRLLWFNPNTLESNASFEVIGKILGMAIYNSIILDLHLPLTVYKKILNKPTSIEDLREIDPELVRGLEQLLAFEGNIEETFCRTFTVESYSFGHPVTQELILGGSLIPVTQENKAEYVEKYANWWINDGIKDKFEAFKRGFFRVCGGEVIQWFKPEELELLICGNPVLDFHELEKVTEYEGYSRDSETIQMFWEVVHSFDENQKKEFLKFVTGSDRAPINGLGSMKFVVSRNGGDSERLMTAMTCYNHLLLPAYGNMERMRRLILLAIENAEGFGLR